MFSRWSRSLLSMSNVIPLGLRQEFSLLSRCTYATDAPVDKPLSNNPTAFARYARRECYCLSMTDKGAIFSGNFVFASLSHEKPSS